MYQTQPYSLDFWLRMQVRLTAAFANGRQKLAEFRELSFKANIDDAELGRKRANAARADGLRLLAEVEALRVLTLGIEAQIRPVFNGAELPQLLSRMACVRDVLETYRTVSDLPPRTPAEEDLADFERRYAALKNAGNGEAVVADRERLRSQAVSLRALGREEGVAYEEKVRHIETSLDHMVTQVQDIKTRTFLAVDVAEEAIPLLAAFGIKVYEKAGSTDASTADANSAGSPAAAPEAEGAAESNAVPDAPPAHSDERIEPRMPESAEAAGETSQA
jgi:hypothetical protein